MLENYHILTLTHKKVPLDRLGTFVIQATDDLALRTKLEEIKAQFELDELLYLATCNRVLFFMHAPGTFDHALLTEFFQYVYPGIEASDSAQLSEWVGVYSGMHAITHLYEVAASIDSMVIGERQILGQLRDAFDQSQAWNLSGDAIRLALNMAVQAAKAVYTHTRIGDKPVSIASLAVQKLLRLHVSRDARILMVGAGQTNVLVAKFLQKYAYHHVDVFNRTPEKADALAATFQHGHGHPIKSLPDYQGGFDVLIVCTGASTPVIDPQLYETLLQGETAPKVVIDLSLPHNVDPEVVRQYPVQYVGIEDLRQLAKENFAFRKQEMEHARTLLASYTAEFPQQYRQRRLEIALRQVPESIKAVKEKALSEVFKKEVETLDPDTRQLVERMLGYMEKKCIGIPMKAAREAII